MNTSVNSNLIKIDRLITAPCKASVTKALNILTEPILIIKMWGEGESDEVTGNSVVLQVIWIC